MVDTNSSPAENIYRLFSKTPRPFYARVLFHQYPDTNKPEELAKDNIRAFNCSVGLHQNEFIEKRFWQEGYKLCEASQDTDTLFVHCIKFH